MIRRFILDFAQSSSPHNDDDDVEEDDDDGGDDGDDDDDDDEEGTGRRMVTRVFRGGRGRPWVCHATRSFSILARSRVQ